MDEPRPTKPRPWHSEVWSIKVSNASSQLNICPWWIMPSSWEARQIGDGRGYCHGNIVVCIFYIQVSCTFSSFHLYMFIEVLYIAGPRRRRELCIYKRFCLQETWSFTTSIPDLLPWRRWGSNNNGPYYCWSWRCRSIHGSRLNSGWVWDPQRSLIILHFSYSFFTSDQYIERQLVIWESTGYQEFDWCLFLFLL